MKVIGKLFLGLAASVFSVTAIAADFDGSKALMCSFARIIECDAGSMCTPTTNESVDAPDFFKLDFKKKQVIGISAGVEGPPDDIDKVTDLAKFVVVQGVQGGAEGASDTLAWSASINHETGAMVVTGSGENAGFVVFGVCTTI